jgi:3-oxoacyl-(acyl-carrier-protein) synthase
MKRVFVTGIGIISSIGNNIEENLIHLKSGKTGIARAKFSDSVYSKSHDFGEVKCSTESLKTNLGFNEPGLTRTDLLAFKALIEAIETAQLSSDEVSSRDTAFVSASTIGGMCMTDQLYEDANLMSSGSEYIASYSGTAHALKIAKKYELSGIVDTLNTACSSSTNTIIEGARLIKSGRVKRAIVGGVDSLGKFTINGFNALQIMSETPCKPFDENRCGLTLGEGAAYLILEAEDCVGNKPTLAEILGYGNSNDAYHSSSLSEEAVGIVEAISNAIKSAGISPQEVDYINAHGTATQNNDVTELKGIQKALGYFPPFNSTKSYTGHTLAAAGVIEAVFSVLSIQHQELYPSLNCETPIAPYNKLPIDKYQPNYKIKNVLSNSFGFGGNCSSIIISQS